MFDQEEETARLREGGHAEEDLMEFNLEGRPSTLSHDSLDGKVVIESVPKSKKLIFTVITFLTLLVASSIFYLKKIAPIPGSLLSYKS